MLPNSPAYILSTTGALGAGVIVTTINPSYTPHEVARQIKMSKAKAILSNVALLPVVNEAIQLLGKLDHGSGYFHCSERNSKSAVVYYYFIKAHQLRTEQSARPEPWVSL